MRVFRYTRRDDHSDSLARRLARVYHVSPIPIFSLPRESLAVWLLIDVACSGECAIGSSLSLSERQRDSRV